MFPVPDIPKPPAALRGVFRVWFLLGLQSFGGGTATLALIRRAAVEQQEWLTEAEFASFWSLVQLAPGTNLLALTVLIGRKTAGIFGIGLALAGLLLPSVAVTVLLTAFYARFAHSPVVREAADGIIPAVVGMGLVTAWQIARPLLAQARRTGRGSLILSLCLLVGSGLTALRFHPPVVFILGSSALIFAVWNWGRHKVRGTSP